jgi:methionyl-tRNA formyltransferase
MRIAFFGLPLAALFLQQDGHRVGFAAISRPGSPGMRRLVRLLGEERIARRPDVASDAVFECVRASRPDLIVSWFWTTRLPRRLLELAPRGAIGVHPSLLPRHRGPDPYFWAIDCGDAESGVTAHQLDEAYDTGAILAQRALTILPSWNAWTLAKKLDRPSLALLREVTHAYARGAPPLAIPQDDKSSTLAPEPDDSLLALRWDSEALLIVRRVRAASPWPGAFTTIGEEPVTLTEVRATEDFPRALAPGEAFVRGDGVAVVRARDAAVELLQGRSEGDLTLDRDGLADLVGRAGHA